MTHRFKRNLFLFALALLIFPGSIAAGGITELKVNYHSQAFTSGSAKLVTGISEKNNLPWEWDAITPAYDYSFANAGFYDPSRPLELRIYYGDDNDRYKQIFAYDNWAGIWKPLLSQDNPRENYVSTITTSPLGKVIVLSNPDIMTVGTASWYAYKGGDFAASPDFKKGSVLRVHNLDNGKFLDVTINDWGPERDKFPDRVIDLDKLAFAKLASTGAGLINVRIEPQEIAVTEAQEKNPQMNDAPSITASSAIIIAEDTGEILWNKNSEKQAPIASLTKLMAVKVFLDTRPSLNSVVSYKYQDEAYNYQYVKPWESARIGLTEGETVTIEDLVYSSLVGSANNAIETLVRVSKFSRDEFVAKMNETAKKWGTTSTHFVEPTGLSPNNVSSPHDYAIISKEVFSNPLIKKISTAIKYKFYTINTEKVHYLANTNQLLRSDKYNILGSKTGYLDESGYCLMTKVRTKYGDIIVVNLNSSTKAENFLDNEQLIRYGEKLLQNR